MLLNKTINKEYTPKNHSNKIIYLEPKNKGFIYHPGLDANFLYEFHGSDWEQVLFSIDLFLEFTTQDVFKLISHLKNHGTAQITPIVHKIRPGFRMVGLSDFEVFFSNVKFQEFQNLDRTQLAHIVTFWEDYFYEKLEIIRMERIRLEFFIKNKAANLCLYSTTELVNN